MSHEPPQRGVSMDLMHRHKSISIVTISYNKGPYLEECIRSVLEQDCPGTEYIVVEAGSTDDSPNVVRRYRDRIDCIIDEPDRGPADGLNKGFSRTNADIFGYLNADDRFLPGTLKYVVDYFNAHPEIDVLTGAIRIIDEHGRASWRKRTPDAFDLADYAAGICVSGQQATFFRRKAFEAAGRFNINNRIAWDGELLVDMALAGCRFNTVYKLLGDFRIYGESITGSSGYRDKLFQYRDQIRDKISQRGVALHPPNVEKLRRIFYKINPLRHLAYMLVS
jgi:glycosyltransferase involved in cell wall biosynthesis